MRLDVRTKLLMLGLANACFFFRVEGWLEMMVVGVLWAILYTLGKPHLSLGVGLAYLVMVGLSLAPLIALPPYFYRLLTFVLVAGKLIYPSFLAALIVIKTTTVYELVHGLRKWHIPEVWLLTFAVMFRFLPLIRQESRIIHRSLKIRGIFLNNWAILTKPKQYLEYLLVPLLLSLIRSSHELTIASLTKGLAVKRGASECFKSYLTWKDWGVQLWIIITIAIMIAQ
ncbi:energy-coupling factor transporter transmembrane component T [Streptococcus castoreus]|uniref:energy-coupling factor transporter transmembrane component T n=1 Tax=Streptococcus castoreus TaxID=254786 RepID=UPI00048A0FFB|nr:energy-coupling factor transporter transmembrane component T [Streptococcus castoreus]